MKKKIFSHLLLILTAFFFFDACGGNIRIRGMFYLPRKKPNRTKTQSKHSSPTHRQRPSQLSPEEMASKALSCYETAREYEDHYSKTKVPTSAEWAIKNYRLYYKFQPDGPLACLALLRCAELLYRTGNYAEARKELNYVKKRIDFRKKCIKEIDKIEALIYN